MQKYKFMLINASEETLKAIQDKFEVMLYEINETKLKDIIKITNPITDPNELINKHFFERTLYRAIGDVIKRWERLLEDWDDEIYNESDELCDWQEECAKEYNTAFTKCYWCPLSINGYDCGIRDGLREQAASDKEAQKKYLQLLKEMQTTPIEKLFAKARPFIKEKLEQILNS